MNTVKRKEESRIKNKFDEEFYKSMSNSVYGKTMENIRNRLNIKLCNNGKQVSKLIFKPTYKHRTVIDENMILVHMLSNKLILDKPIYIAWSILELAKLEMYKFLYDIIKPKIGDKEKLLMSDTDSFIIEFTDVNAYEFIRNNLNYFDVSNYPNDHFIFKEIQMSNIDKIKSINEKVLRKMKDELGGKLIKEFIGLKSKMYVLDTEDDKFNNHKDKRSKGIKYCVVKKELTIKDYRKMLSRIGNGNYLTQKLIRSKKHPIYTEAINKIELSSPLDDNKNYVDIDKIVRYPWSHYMIPNIKIANKFINFLLNLKKLMKSKSYPTFNYS